MMSTERVIGVTVTYGERHAMCLQVLDAFVAEGVDEIVLVLNGVSAPSESALRAWCTAAEVPTRIYKFFENSGSAPAFAKGLAIASGIDCAFIWLLDDDNVPVEGALSKALAARAFVSDATAAAFVCYRESDEGQRSLAHGAPYRVAFPPRGAFFGLDIFHRLQARRVRARHLQPLEEARSVVRMQEAPYGGLLVPREVVQRSGLPDQRLVLYFDDVEYSRRLVRSGVNIYLCPNARVVDLGVKWVHRERRDGYLKTIIRSGDRPRSYYSFRNSVYVDLIDLGAVERVRYLVNGLVYFGWLLLQSRGRVWIVLLFLRAVRDGFCGNLGESARFPLRRQR